MPYVDLTSNHDEADVVDNQSDWDKNVNDGINRDNENITETDVGEEDRCEE